MGKVLHKHVWYCGIMAVLCTPLAMWGGTVQAEENGVYSLDPIIVTANRVPQKITQADADVSVVTLQQIETMHIQNVEEALRLVPGVEFLSYGATNLFSDLNGVRINGSKDIVLLIDGVRMTDFQGVNNSGYMYAAMLKNMDNIEQIEVLRGAAATMYGSGAKGGVINIITRKPNKVQTVVDISNGKFGKENYNIDTQGKIDRLTYNVYYGKSIQGNVTDANGWKWPGHSNSKNMGTSLTYRLDDRNSLSLIYNNIRNDYAGYDMYYKENLHGCKYYANDMTLRHEYTISDKWKNVFTYRRNRVYSTAKVDEYGSTFTFWDSRYHYRFWSDQITYDSKSNTVVMGVDYSRAMDMSERDPYASSPTWMSNISSYVQDSWKITPKITLSGGLRYDDPDRGDPVKFHSHTSKSYKLSYAPTNKDTIYAGRSDFFILPGIDELTNPQYGNDKLNPAYGRTSSIGYSRTFSRRNMFTLNWFYTKSEETIGYDSDGKYENYTNDVARGWNAQWITQLDNHWNATIGWAHLYQKADHDNYAYGYAPKDLATFGVYYRCGKWDAGLDGFYFMRRTSQVEHLMGDWSGWPSDKYAVVNMSVTYQAAKNINVYVKGENIFDKLWCEQTQALWGEAGQYYSQPGRNFTVGMQYKF